MDPAGNLRNDIQTALHRQYLTIWQRTFVTDIHARLDRSGGQVRLSDKQWRKIFEILGRPNNVIAMPPRTATSRSISRRVKKPFRSPFRRAGKRLQWRLRKIGHWLLVVAAVAVGQQAFDLGREQFRSSPTAMRASSSRDSR
ncbi:hypothetical protein HJB78_26660 [Rhizobium lentis]|uniref:hypothetical protein n=1 Tax=Rhizobium lentis TaxID=1138194 RepID=UPI001C83B867|nr:hypothetical protein [Rhizobium lentis]MBX5154506.1 hypothetical protein [Rhizobium lentis]